MDKLVKDYEGFREMMIQAIPEKCPAWTDTSQGDFGIVLIELFASVADKLGYYIDRNFMEGTIKTAQLRERVIQHANFLTYTPQDQVPARFSLLCTKDADALATEVIVPRGKQVSTKASDIIFEAIEDLVIPAGTATGRVLIEQGETLESNVQIDAVSTNLRIKLNSPDVLRESVSVKIVPAVWGGEIAFNQVSDLFDSGANSNDFYIEYDGENFAYVVFGDGLFGALPPVGLCIVSYKQCLGAQGNVGINTITEQIGWEVEGLASITNDQPLVQLGKDIESVESIKYNAPRAYRARNSIVTSRDAEYFAEQSILVGRALGVDTFNANNELDVYVTSTTLQNLSTQDKLNLKNYLTNDCNKMSNLVIVVKDLIVINFSISVTAEITGADSRATKKAQIEDALLNTLSGNVLEIGDGLVPEMMYGIVMSVGGLKYTATVTPSIATPAVAKAVYNLSSVSVTLTGGIA